MANLSERAFAAQAEIYAVEDAISDAMLDADMSLEFAELGFDDFDKSLAIMGAEDEMKPNDKFLDAMWEHGFKTVHVLYESGETLDFHAPEADDSAFIAPEECPVSGECCT